MTKRKTGKCSVSEHYGEVHEWYWCDAHEQSPCDCLDDAEGTIRELEAKLSKIRIAVVGAKTVLLGVAPLEKITRGDAIKRISWALEELGGF